MAMRTANCQCRRHLGCDCQICCHHFKMGDRTGVALSPADFCLQPHKVSTGAHSEGGKPAVSFSGWWEVTDLGHVTGSGRFSIGQEMVFCPVRRAAPSRNKGWQESCFISSQGQAGEVATLCSQLLHQQAAWGLHIEFKFQWLLCRYIPDGNVQMLSSPWLKPSPRHLFGPGVRLLTSGDMSRSWLCPDIQHP